MNRHLAGTVALILFAAPGAASAQQPRSTRCPLGTNLAAATDWCTELPFADAFKSSRPWIAADMNPTDDNASVDGTLTLDARGWVTRLNGHTARTLILWGQSNAPAGDYLVTYDGEGTIQFSLADGTPLQLAQRPGLAGQFTLTLDPGATRSGTLFGVQIDITSTDPRGVGNYVRNIKVRLPNAGPNDEFNPVFLDRIGKYRCLRFMNPMLGDNDEIDQGSWATRPVKEDARWTALRLSATSQSSRGGVPVEVLCDLCNAVHADGWFCIPHLADDDYVRNFAQAVKANLDPALRAHVEYSNEVWNSQFTQHQYAVSQGRSLNLDADDFNAGGKYHALRSRQIFGVFESVLPPSRLVRVLGGFSAIPTFNDMMLGFQDVAAHTDALAIAPYLDPSSFTPASVGGVLDDLERNALPMVTSEIQQNAAVVRSYPSVQLIAYEGGQEMVVPNSTWDSSQGDPAPGSPDGLFNAANRDARMGTIYTSLLKAWSDAGGQLFCHYTNCGAMTRFGRFGSLEYISQPRAQAPKYDALEKWIEGSPAGTSTSTSTSASAPAGSGGGSGSSSSSSSGSSGGSGGSSGSGSSAGSGSASGSGTAGGGGLGTGTSGGSGTSAGSGSGGASGSGSGSGSATGSGSASGSGSGTAGGSGTVAGSSSGPSTVSATAHGPAACAFAGAGADPAGALPYASLVLLLVAARSRRGKLATATANA